jgi:hypothetical protein
MLMADFSCLSDGGAMALTECRRLGSDVRGMTVSEWLCFFGGGTLVVRIVFLRHAWSRCGTSWWLSKSSYSICDEKVDSPRSSLSVSLIFQSVSLSSCVMRIIGADISYLKHYTRRLGEKFKHLIDNEDWMSAAMHMQVLSQGGLLDSSVKSDSSPGLAEGSLLDEVKLGNVDRRM